MEVQGNAHIDKFWPIMIALFFGSFFSALASSTINIALPVLQDQFGTTLSTIQWVMTGFMLAMGTFAPVTGYFGERFSYKRLYVFSLIGFTAASVLCAMATTVVWLIVFRILQGVFCGVIVPSAMAVIYQVIPRAKQPMAIGIWSASAMLAPAIGPTLSGWILEHVSWHWIFWMNLPIGIIAVIMVQLFMPYYRMSVPKTFDLMGFVTVIVSSSSILVALSQGRSWGWSSASVLSLFTVGFVFLGLFIWRELTAETPLLNLRVFRNGRYTMALAISCILNIALYSGMLMTPIFLQTIQGVTPMDAGLILLPSSLAMAVSMPFVGKLYTKVGPRVLVICGLLLVTLGSLPLSWLSVNTSHSYLLWCMVARSLGIGLTMMPVSNYGMEQISRQMSGHASSINNWVRSAFGSFAIAVFTSIMASRSAVHGSELAASGIKDLKVLMMASTTMGINDVYLIATFVSLAAVPLAFFIRKHIKQGQPGGIETEAAVLKSKTAS
ncbi:MAG: transporter [Paenibacillaceae bacterium]|jgi:EmrB/QacA subfamily drug resistance transporter|nr:transporter [Paenibacillaceae bacterium]